jgi:hypothetical protein
MKKQFNKTAKLMVGVIIETAVSNSSLMANGAFPMQGYLIPTTPFDNKVMSSGAFFPLDVTASSHTLDTSDALFEISRSFRYVSDEGRDYWQTPEETEAKGSGDCEDKAVWLYVQLKKNNVDSARLVIGRYRSIDRGLHVWVTMTDKDGHMIVLDPSKQKRVWALTDFSEKYYNPIYSFDGFNRYRHSV